MHRKCEISATGLFLILIMSILIALKQCGIARARADMQPYKGDEPASTALVTSRAEISLPAIIGKSDNEVRPDVSYLSGLIHETSYPAKVSFSARGPARLDIEASCNREQLDNRPGAENGLFFLRLSDLIDIGDWRLEHGLGDQTAGHDNLVLASNRFSFSSTKMRGISGIADNGRTRFNWSIGNVGQLHRSELAPFEVTQESVSGLGVNHHLNRHWRLSGQTLALSRSDSNPKRGYATALQYSDTKSARRYSMHVINDDQRRSGYWLDMDFGGENWRHYYSLYRFEPNLRWSSASLPDDRQGAFWKVESSVSDLTLSTGLELEQSNLNHDNTRSGHTRTRAYGSLSRAWNENLTVKGRLHSEDQRRFSGLPGMNRRSVSMGVSLEEQAGFGLSRIDVLWAATRTEVSPTDTIHICLDQEWQFRKTHKLTARLAVDRRTQDENELTYPATALILNRAVSQQIALVGSLYYVLDEDREPIDTSPGDWCEEQIGCHHGTGGSVWIAMKAFLH